MPWEKIGLSNITRDNLELNREVLLDRYKQGTIHCSSCRKPLKKIQFLQGFLLAYFTVSVSVVSLIPNSLRLKFGLPLIILALVGLGFYSWLKFWLQPKFYFVDYVHSER